MENLDTWKDSRAAKSALKRLCKETLSLYLEAGLFTRSSGAVTRRSWAAQLSPGHRRQAVASDEAIQLPEFGKYLERQAAQLLSAAEC